MGVLYSIGMCVFTLCVYVILMIIFIFLIVLNGMMISFIIFSVCVYYIGMCIFFTLCTCIDVYYIVVGILKRAGALLVGFSGFVPPLKG